MCDGGGDDGLPAAREGSSADDQYVEPEYEDQRRSGAHGVEDRSYEPADPSYRAAPQVQSHHLQKRHQQQQSDALGEGDADRQQRDKHKLPGRHVGKGADVAPDRAAVRRCALRPLPGVSALNRDRLNKRILDCRLSGASKV